MTGIQQIDTNTFTLSSRGTDMKLVRQEGGTWVMFADNASRRAWGGLGVKHFTSLVDVEAHYKSWRGISQLVA